MIRQIFWDEIRKSVAINMDEMSLYIESLLRMKCEIEKHGTYGFDGFLATKADTFERVAIKIVVSGMLPELCADVLSNILNSSVFDENTYLKNTIFSEFVLAIQKSEIGIQELRIRLYSYLGVEGINKLYDLEM